jgi:hypothetical protein
MRRKLNALLLVAGLLCVPDSLRAQSLCSGGVTATVGTSFTSPDGAIFSSVAAPAAGTEITGGSVGLINHMIIVPTTQPSLGTSDYEVTALVYVINPDEEFGVMARVQPDGRGYLFSIHWGGQNSPALNRPMIGVFNNASTWNPKDIQPAPAAISNFNLAGHEYFLKLRVAGNNLSGRVWDASQPEPTTWIATAVDSTFSSGTGVGFYNYADFSSSILESLVVVTTPQPDGTCCDSGIACHVGDACQAGVCVNNMSLYPYCTTLYNDTVVSVQNAGATVFPTCSATANTLSLTDANGGPLALTLPANTTGPINVTLAPSGATSESILVQGASMPAGSSKTIALNGVSTSMSLCVDDSPAAAVTSGLTCAAPAQTVPLPSAPLCLCKQYSTGCFCNTVTSCDSPPTTTPTSSNCNVPTRISAITRNPTIFASLPPAPDITAVCAALAAVGTGRSICADNCSGDTCRVVFGGSLNTFVREVPDADGDGVPNCLDRCPNTTNLTGPIPTRGRLLPGHLGDANLIFGCNADDILACKPGDTSGERYWGISPETAKIFESIGSATPIGWAAGCARKYPRPAVCQ